MPIMLGWVRFRVGRGTTVYDVRHTSLWTWQSMYSSGNCAVMISTDVQHEDTSTVEARQHGHLKDTGHR